MTTLATKYEAHPHSAIFTPMQDDDFEKLAADIKANGLQQPITLYQGKVLDGNNRYRACLQLGREPGLWSSKAPMHRRRPLSSAPTSTGGISVPIKGGSYWRS